jgi:hypothetical protein
MANTTLASPLRGSCLAPFYDASKFDLGGCRYSEAPLKEYMLIIVVVDGRFCAPAFQIEAGLYCCLPCPMTDYLYPQGQLT